MKILFVSMQFGRGYVQGTERYLGSLGVCLRDRGHRISYLAGDPLRLRPRAARLGAQIADAEAPGELFSYPSRGWPSIVGISVRRLARWLRSHRPDIVHVANPAHVGVGIISAARESGIPVVVTVMDFWWLCPKATLLRFDGDICDAAPGWAGCACCIAGENSRAWVRSLARLPRFAAPLTAGMMLARAAVRGMRLTDMARWLRRREVLMGRLAGVDEIIFPSKAVADRLATLHGPCCTRIPYGLSPEWFQSPRESRAAGVPAADLVVGYAGAMLPHKGPHLLLQAVRQLGWTRTLIRLAGPLSSDDYGLRLRRLAEGLKVEFTGRLPGEKMPAFLRSLDVLAMTSLWPENLPFIVLEAQAAGVPVVGSRVAGVAEQIGSDELVFEPGSVDGLARALERVRGHPETVPVSRVRTVDEMTDETEAVYRRALS